MAHSLDVVGIDVSKQDLDLYVLAYRQLRTVANTVAGHAELASWLKSLGVKVAVMEASGGYERTVARALQRAGC
jgi:transposase